MKDHADRRPEEIQADIERTRSQLDQTLSAIERRLEPGQLFEEGLEYVRHSGAREYVTNLARAAKQDPMPLALVGVGLAWMMLSNGRGPRHESSGQGASDEITSSLKDKASSLKDKVHEVREKVSQTTQQISDRAHAASERVSQVGESARQQAERVRGGYERLVNDQPLALGAIGLALGAVLGGLAPRTRSEDELMGDASDRAMDDVKQAGREQLEKVKEATAESHGGAQDEEADAQARAQAEPPSPPRQQSQTDRPPPPPAVITSLPPISTTR